MLLALFWHSLETYFVRSAARLDYSSADSRLQAVACASPASPTTTSSGASLSWMLPAPFVWRASEPAANQMMRDVRAMFSYTAAAPSPTTAPSPYSALPPTIRKPASKRARHAHELAEEAVEDKGKGKEEAAEDNGDTMDIKENRDNPDGKDEDDTDADADGSAKLRVHAVVGKKALEDRRTLAESGVSDGSTVDVVFRLARTCVFTVSSDGTGMIWSADSGECLSVLCGHTAAVLCVDRYLDGSKIVTGSTDKTARLWSVPDGECLAVFKGHHAGVLGVTVSPSSCCIGTTSADRTLKLWRESGQCALTLPFMKEIGKEVVVKCSTSPDGMFFVTSSKEKSAKIRSKLDGLPVRALEGHTQVVNHACYSPNGRFLGTASGDMTARVWDAKTFKVVGILRGHTGTVNWIEFSSDDQRAVTCSNDCTVKVWDADTCACVATLCGHSHHVYSCSFSSAGDRIVTASRDGTAKIWCVTYAACVRTLDGHKGLVNQAMWSP
mmetsp:Transcript_8171/g.25979  ORF Transcript_8171/g.25979 Transcript_8171/m.25979 type:complete len:497 (+) Transcript_8171:60-1550(+)